MKNLTLSDYIAETTKESETEILNKIPTFNKLNTLYSTLHKVIAIKQSYTHNALTIKNNINNILYITLHNTTTDNKIYTKIQPSFIDQYITETEHILSKLKTLQNLIIDTINNITNNIETEPITLEIQNQYLPEENTNPVQIIHFIQKSNILVKNPTLQNIINANLSAPIKTNNLMNNKTVKLLEVYAKTKDNQPIILSDDAVVTLLNNPKLIKKEHIFITSQHSATPFKTIKKFIISYNYRPYIQHLAEN
jgi:hypothetical protein